MEAQALCCHIRWDNWEALQLWDGMGAHSSMWLLPKPAGLAKNGSG